MSAEFEALGRMLFGTTKSGHGWKKTMSRQTGHSYETISTWGKRNPVPAAVLWLMRELAETRRLMEAHREAL